MSYLDDIERPKNELNDASFNFLVEQLFSKLDVVSSEHLGPFPNVTSKKNFIIESFIQQWKQFIGNDIFPAARLIFPNRDKRLYFIKDVVLARLVIKMFNIPKNSIDYDKLFNYKKHYHDYMHLNRYANKHLRSLPLIISQIISERRDPSKIVKSTFTINQINEILDELCSPEATKSEIQIGILKPVIEKLTIEEIRWFTTMILKKSILASFEVIFFRAWHPDAPRLFNICNNLSKVFWLLTDPEKRLDPDQLNVQLMYPFLPQLSQKLSISYDQLCNKMNNEFFIEEKMDGDRMIMHMENNKFKFFSRRTKDYTLLYGSNLQIGSLTKHLRDAFDPKVKSIILDGEMVAWDYKRNLILPFGTLKASAVQEAVRQFTTTDVFEQQSSWPLFIIFDILHLNGKDLTRYPLFYRKDLLHKVINPIPHKFEILQFIKCKDANDIKLAIRNIISERSEGIMVKNTKLNYHVASRNNCWIKIKPEYLEQFGENLDLVVIGIIPGIKNSYICGLRDSDDNDIFKSFCTVANGFSENEFNKIERLTTGKWVEYKKRPPPDDLLKFGTKKPTSWIHPNESVVLEIKARSIDCTYLSTYAVGTTLHNLYCRGIREDKLYYECITLNEYKEIKLKYSSEFNKSQSIVKNRKRFINSFEEKLTNDKRRQIEVISKLFGNFKFLILSDKLNLTDNERISILEIGKTIKRYGGAIIHNPLNQSGDKQIVTLSEKLTTKCEIYLKKGFDIIMPEWVFECIRRNSIVPLEPSFILDSINPTIVENARNQVDGFGDSYVINVREPVFTFVQRLKIPHSLSKEKFHEYTDDFINELNRQDISLPIGFLFYNINFYLVDATTVCEWQLKILERKIERFQGKISSHLPECSFIIVSNASNQDSLLRDDLLSRVNSLSKEISQSVDFGTQGMSKIPRVVNETFIDQCIKYNVLVDPQDHLFV